MSQQRANLEEKASIAQVRLVAELRGIVDRVLDKAASLGDDSAVIAFTNNCTKFGHTESTIVTSVTNGLIADGFKCTLYKKVEYGYGNIIYTIHSDGTYKSAPTRAKDYVDTIEIRW
jgi:hypothetical protein